MAAKKAYKHQQSLFNKTSFFPLLCRTSKKDVKLRNCRDHSSSSSTSSEDPSSPKVSCIGQIRRTNKVIGFSSNFTPNSHRVLTFAVPTKSKTIITAKTHSLGNYEMLRRWFSGRNVNVASSSTGSGCGGSGGTGSGKSSCSSTTRCSRINHLIAADGNVVRVDVDDLEPPLPVVIKNVNQTSEVNLWERRCGGLALRSLEPISR